MNWRKMQWHRIQMVAVAEWWARRKGLTLTVAQLRNDRRFRASAQIRHVGQTIVQENCAEAFDDFEGARVAAEHYAAFGRWP